jgi:uncharacterized membrane protein YfcA
MPDLPLWLWIVTLITALVASTVTTVTSIGAGLITYGILGFVFDLKVLIPLVAPAQLLGVSLRCWLFRCHIQWWTAFYLFLGVIPGIFVGARLFHVMSESTLRRVLGVLLLAFALYEFWRDKEVQTSPRLALLPIGGLGAGLLLGSVGVAGPLLAIVFLRYGLVKESLVAMISLFFLVGNAQRVLLYWQQGRLTADGLGLGVAMGMAMIAGVYLGRMILPRISQAVFVKLVLFVLVLFGVKFLFW